MVEKEEQPNEPRQLQGEEKGAKSLRSASAQFYQASPPASSLPSLPTTALSEHGGYQCTGSFPGHEISREQLERLF